VGRRRIISSWGGNAAVGVTRDFTNDTKNTTKSQLNAIWVEVSAREAMHIARILLLIAVILVATGLLVSCNTLPEEANGDEPNEIRTEFTEEDEKMKEIKGILMERMTRVELTDEVATLLAQSLHLLDIGAIVKVECVFSEEQSVGDLRYEMYEICITDDRGYTFQFRFTKGGSYGTIRKSNPDGSDIALGTAPMW
jgi:hypothetical protein